MKGAREYAQLFRTGQYGRLYIESGAHARGRTFHIYVLPEGSYVCGSNRVEFLKYAVEVYGILGGNPGWTEYYGWLHHGKWVEDFYKMVENKKAEILAEQQLLKREQEECDRKKREQEKQILDSYK